jgi:hypothetical protein
MLASARIDVCDLEKHSDEILQAMLRSHDQRAALTPPLSMRLDLQTRYSWRQYKRSRGRLSHRYDPTNRGKRNDGIDFNLYTYLALPALIVAGEGGFFGSIADITSFQREWIMRPATLAQAWERGERPRPLFGPCDSDLARRSPPPGPCIALETIAGMRRMRRAHTTMPFRFGQRLCLIRRSSSCSSRGPFARKYGVPFRRSLTTCSSSGGEERAQRP